MLDLGHADTGAFQRRFDNQRQPERIERVCAVAFAFQHLVGWCRVALCSPDLLAAQFVHRERRPEYARAGIRQPHDFEQTLHGAVLAAAAVQHDQRTVKITRGQHGGDIALHIDRMHIHVFPLQRIEHGFAAEQ